MSHNPERKAVREMEATNANDLYPQYVVTKVPEIPTLRDFFAGCALIGEVLKVGLAQYDEVDASRGAYLAADAMLKARGGDTE